MSEPQPRVLLVDDRPENLLALEAVLEPLGLDLVSVRSGDDALRRLLADEFAVIILDVQMPVLDGFETARLIKGRERTRHVPIIFLTAISGALEHHLKGYEAGAVDYLSKPFEPEILRAKVMVLSELWQRGVVIQHQLDELDRLHQSLARQAVELERSNAALDHFAQVAARDLVNPLNTAAGFIDLLRTRHGLEGEAAMLAERAAAGLDRARAHVGELLALARVSTEELQLTEVALADAVAESAAEVGVGVDEGNLPVVRADRRLLVLLLTELLRTLAGHGEGEGVGDGTKVRVEATPEDGRWRIALATEQQAVSDADVPRLFTVFAGAGATGLALSRRIVERHGGAIECRSSRATGTTFSFTVPKAGS
ncbi:MAG: hybrid sensor histidine kinase/response regulator [Acidimicrobiales bacterium]